MAYKRYVDVEVLMRTDGTMEPKALYWQVDIGVKQKYVIDKIISVSLGSRLSSVGSVGRQYVVIINGQRRTMYLEKNKWFIESLKG